MKKPQLKIIIKEIISELLTDVKKPKITLPRLGGAEVIRIRQQGMALRDLKVFENWLLSGNEPIDLMIKKYYLMALKVSPEYTTLSSTSGINSADRMFRSFLEKMGINETEVDNIISSF